MLGDERGSAGLSLRHPHRRDRPPRNPSPQRDRAEPGVLLHRRARRRGEQRRAYLDAQQLPGRAFGENVEVFGRVPAAAIADRSWLSPARLPDDVLAGALSQRAGVQLRSEEHTSELQSLMRISYAVFCLKKKRKPTRQT